MRVQSSRPLLRASSGVVGSVEDIFLYLHRDPGDPVCGSLDVHGLSPDVLSQLQLLPATATTWQACISVFVETTDQGGEDSRPAVLGHYAIAEGCVRFTPRYAFMKGVAYQVRINLAPLTGGGQIPTVRRLSFSTPQPPTVARPAVTAVFPSGDLIPENTLRFYIHFSAPMRYGSSREQVALFGPDGHRVDGAFLDLATELWDPDMRRLTVLLHPGRIKRGVGANIEVGPALVAGQRYSIVVADGMADRAECAPGNVFQKSFVAVAAERQPIDPLRWSVERPMPKTRQPLVLEFPSAMDRAILAQSLRVVDVENGPVAGDITISEGEKRWTFAPEVAWRCGPHQLLVDQRLEDVCGNRIAAPFDIDRQAGITRARPPGPYVLPIQIGPSVA